MRRAGRIEHGAAIVRDIAGSDRNLGVAAWNVKHIGRLREAGQLAPQLAHEGLSLGDAGAEAVRAGRKVGVMQVVGLDAHLDEGAHQLREDGRVIRDMYLARVKKPQDSKEPWDYLEIVKTVKGDDAYRPVAESKCPLLKK